MTEFQQQEGDSTEQAKQDGTKGHMRVMFQGDENPDRQGSDDADDDDAEGDAEGHVMRY